MPIVGIDEVGRGSLAGPLVAGAVVLARPIVGLKDSKKLTRQQRQKLDVQIRAEALAFGLGWVSSEEIDQLGLTGAVRLAMERALEVIHLFYDHIIIDGKYNFMRTNVLAEAIIKADDRIPEVSAASIIAKVARDQFMAERSTEFPGYGFERHVGYGTSAHLNALQDLGICELHRRSFRPVQLLTL